MTATPTPEVIEAAAQAIFECSDPFSAEECAKAALTAAAPFIAAQAKAEGWEEGHEAGWDDRDEMVRMDWTPSGYTCAGNPYRAATIEGKSE